MNEIYRLRLDHYMVADEERLQLDEPMVVQSVITNRMASGFPMWNVVNVWQMDLLDGKQ